MPLCPLALPLQLPLVAVPPLLPLSPQELLLLLLLLLLQPLLRPLLRCYGKRARSAAGERTAAMKQRIQQKEAAAKGSHDKL